MKTILVGVKQDDGKIKHIKCFGSPTWALKYGKNMGDAAMYATIDVEFTNTPPLGKDNGQGKQEQEEQTE